MPMPRHESLLPPTPTAPLAERMRPRTLEEMCGQSSHLLAPGKPSRRAIETNRIHSMVFWGPPDTGKTTLARLLAAYSGADFRKLSAVFSGVKDILEAVAEARQVREQEDRGTILFIKGQQDAFLPHVAEGTLIFIGATTENPSFELNNALLSRARVYVLKPLGLEELERIIKQALKDPVRGPRRRGATLALKQRRLLAEAADGDARRALNLLELAVDAAEDGEIGADLVAEVVAGQVRRFDKDGDAFYDQISALHKSVRGSAPDAALYWLTRMIDSGCDPLYIARRVVRMA